MSVTVSVVPIVVVDFFVVGDAAVVVGGCVVDEPVIVSVVVEFVVEVVAGVDFVVVDFFVVVGAPVVVNAMVVGEIVVEVMMLHTWVSQNLRSTVQYSSVFVELYLWSDKSSPQHLKVSSAR